MAKFPAASGPTRELADRFRLYEREACFYEVLAASCPAPTPRLYFASEAREPPVLVLEDLDRGAEVDLLAGCSLDRAAAITRVMARTHARFWNDPALPEHPWLPEPNHSVIIDLIEESSESAWWLFLSQFGAHMPSSLVRLGDRLVRDRTVLDRLSEPPWTLVHGDLRAHNVVFEDTQSAEPLAVIDWQTVMRGRPAIDLAGLFVSSLSPADRRIAEAELLPAYHARLVAEGVIGYAYEACWRDYCLATINQFSQVVALYALVNVNERISEPVAGVTGERLVAALVDLQLVDMLPPSGLADAMSSAARKHLPAPLRRALRSVFRR